MYLFCSMETYRSTRLHMAPISYTSVMYVRKPSNIARHTKSTWRGTCWMEHCVTINMARYTPASTAIKRCRPPPSILSISGRRDCVTSISGKCDYVTSISGRCDCVTSISGRCDCVTSISGKPDCVTSISGIYECVPCYT
jgi:hypothetical protein